MPKIYSSYCGDSFMFGQSTVPRNLAILMSSGITRTCYCVAMIQSIQRQWPQIAITWFIEENEQSLVDGLAGVDFVRFEKKRGIKEAFRLKQVLNQKLKQKNNANFDVLLMLQTDVISNIISLIVKAKIKIGVSKKQSKNGQQFIAHKHLRNVLRPHLSAPFSSCLAILGIKKQPFSWRMPISDEVQLWGSEQLLSHAELARPCVVISPSGHCNEESWHNEGYAKIVDYLSMIGFSVILTGTSAIHEQLKSATIASLSKHLPLDLTGKTTLKQLLAIHKLAHFIISPDAAPGHMATTVETPVINLYSHTNYEISRPISTQHYPVSCYQDVVQKQFKKPLNKLPWGLRPKGKQLMRGISAAQVKEKIHQLLADHYPEYLN